MAWFAEFGVIAMWASAPRCHGAAPRGHIRTRGNHGEAKSLTTVRELQAAGLLGPDVPTNVYFFFEVHNPRAHGRSRGHTAELR